MEDLRITFTSHANLLSALILGCTITDGASLIKLDWNMQSIRKTSGDWMPMTSNAVIHESWQSFMPMQTDFTSTEEIVAYLGSGGCVITPHGFLVTHNSAGRQVVEGSRAIGKKPYTFLYFHC